MSKYKRLINNSLVFTVGSFGSKLINFLLVPLYTRVLSPDEYGIVDLVIVTINLAIPFLTLETGQAALRFSIDAKNEHERNNIFSNIIGVIILATSIALLSVPLLLYFNLFGEYTIYFVVILITNLFNNVFSQYIRGLGFVKEFAFNGVLMTLVTVTSNILLLLVLDFGVEGYLSSMIIANIASNLFLLRTSNGGKHFRKIKMDFELAKSMLKFSMPIIPNTVMWWVINGSTRYFILYFVGPFGNGLYAIANKVPSILQLLTNIFTQAWQLSSFEEYSTKDAVHFYSKVFNIYYTLLFIGSSFILIILKPFLHIIIDASYYESWKMVPMLLMAVMYQSFSSFLGTIYTASKETKGTFSTSVYAGIVSIIASGLLIPTLGIIGASISTAISFISMTIFRYYDTRKFLNIELNKVIFCLNNMLYIVQVIVLFSFEKTTLLIIETLVYLILLYVNKEVVIMVSKMIFNGIVKMTNRR